MANPVADRNLLFGINALQNDFITRDALIGAMNAWVLEKHRAIGDILVDRGDLNPLDRALLDQLIDRHLARHGGDPLASLAAITSRDGVADDLRRAVDDPDLLASIGQFSTESQSDPHATRAPETVDYIPAGTRFRKVRDHAEGGLGIVFVARDEELNREVALKEIKPKYADNPASQARFLVEAEITGGLEHPGIVPVYGLGHYEDGRPYYAMRFIRGDSLKDALTAFHADKALKDDPGARTLALQKLLRRFLDVCNAVAYAHHRGVLHRDLKPDNVMVGKYGETLVVDWGLAKAVGRSGEDGIGSLPESTLMDRSGSGSAETLPGSLVGTPGYMSPEQAAGRLELLGPATDVYGLGATLYTLLTGLVPFADKILTEVLRKVQHGEFSRPRESTPWLDPALEAITLKAMALKPSDRYESPRALADDLERWIADEPVTAYPEPFARRARRWAGKHRTSLTTASVAALVAALLVGGFAWQRFEHRRRTDAAGRSTLVKAEGLAIQARTSGELLTWDKAVAEALLARERLESGDGSPALRLEAENRLEAFRAEQTRRAEVLAAEAKDSQVVTAFEEARLQAANIFDRQAILDGYLSSFRAYGIDVARLPVEDAARSIRSSRVADELIATLDDWQRYEAKDVLKERLAAIARAAETDPVRATIREAVSQRDAAALRRLCEGEGDRRRLGPRMRYVFNSLLILDPSGSFPLLETILREHPSDFWLNHDLGMAYKNAKPPKPAEAVHFLSIAVALRPDSPGVHNHLGLVLEAQGQSNRAVAEYETAIRLKPNRALFHYNLGIVLNAQGQIDRAIAEFEAAIRLDPDDADAHSILGIILRDKQQPDRAIVEYEAAIRLKPNDADAHSNLGVALQDKHQIDRAIAEFEAAIRLKPNHARAHYNLGVTLQGQGQIDRAIAAYEAAIRLEPDFASSHGNLGVALRAQGQIDRAIAEFEAAIRLKPNDALPHHNLGLALSAQGQLDQAIAEFQVAIRIKPDFADAHSDLGNALYDQGQIDQAIAEYRAAIRIKPDDAMAHFNLGNALRDEDQPDQAIAEYFAAIRIKPDDPGAHCNLGLVLLKMGKFAEALESLEKGHALGSKQPGWPHPSEKWVRVARGLVGLEAKLPALLKGEAKPKDSAERLVLADFCANTGRCATSARFWGEAFAESPAVADDLTKNHRYNAACSASLAASGRSKNEPMPDDPAKFKLREQALGWLRADLAAWGKLLDGGKEPDRKKQVAGKLDNWKADADLAGIRDEAALAKLPDGEREPFRALWADVDRLLTRAKAGKP